MKEFDDEVIIQTKHYENDLKEITKENEKLKAEVSSLLFHSTNLIQFLIPVQFNSIELKFCKLKWYD